MKLLYLMYFLFLIFFNIFSVTKTFMGLPPSNEIIFYTAPLVELFLILSLFLKLINDYGNNNGYSYIIRFRNYNMWYKMMIKKGIKTILLIIGMQIIVIIALKLDLHYFQVVLLNLVVYIHLYVVIIFLNLITNNNEVLIIYCYVIIHYVLNGVLNEIGASELLKIPFYLNINQITRYSSNAVLMIDILIICIVTMLIVLLTSKRLKEKKWKLN